jgi:hypothetical protein
MSSLAAMVPALSQALQQQTDKLNELVISEILASVAGKQSADAYLDQVTAVKEAAAAHQKAAAALKQEQAEGKARQKAAADAGKAVAVAFEGAARFAQSMAQQANPVAWSILQDSLGLVAMQLGQAFLPTIIRVAYYAQEFAQWLHDLSPATKEWMSYLAGAGAAIYVFTKALAFANTMTLGLVSKGISAAVSNLASATVQTQAGLLGVAVVAALLVKNFFDMQQAIQDFNNRQKQSLDEAGKPIEERISRAEFEESEVYKRAKEAKTPEERRKIIAQYSQEGLDESSEAMRDREQAIDRGNSKFRAFGQTVTFGAYSGVTDATKDADAANKRLVEGTKKSGTAVAVAREFGLLPGGEKRFTPIGGAEAHDTSAGRKAREAGKFMAHMPKEMTPHFSAVDEARKNFQMGALKDPLEQQKLAWERENNEALASEIPRILKHIAGNTKEGTGMS